MTGRRETPKDQELEFRVHLMNVSSDDTQKMQLDAKYIPGPIVNDRLSSRFHMPMTMDIAYESDSVVLTARILQCLVQLLSNPREREAPPCSG
jgi:hypothetical protein